MSSFAQVEMSPLRRTARSRRPLPSTATSTASSGFTAKASRDGPEGSPSSPGRWPTSNIDIICANAPQAKGRVERMNKTLQDRLVKDLRLRGISDMASANTFVPAFMSDYNRRFGRPPVNPNDAHRPLLPGQDLHSVFTWQVSRKLTRNLVVHYDCRAYLLEPTAEAMDLGRRRVRVDVHESSDGTVLIRFASRTLPYRVFEKQPLVGAGALLEHKRLGAAQSFSSSRRPRRSVTSSGWPRES
jgi:hypothetical protein